MSQGPIVILGDCYAESMWRFEGTDALANRHIHGILEQHGYKVNNFGKIGGSNLKSWETLVEFLEGMPYSEKQLPGLVIWFHCEVLRDFENNISDIIQYNKQWMYQDLVTKAANDSYSKIKKIIDKCKITNILLIEGSAPVVEPEFSKYIPEPDYTIKSWRNKILDMPDLPETQILTKIDIFEYGHNLDSIDTKTKELNNVAQIRNAMEKSPLFPDSGHPGREAHEQLAAEILDFMEEINQ